MLSSLVRIRKGIQPLKFGQVYFPTLACQKNGMKIDNIVFVKFANNIGKKVRFLGLLQKKTEAEVTGFGM